MARTKLVPDDQLPPLDVDVIYIPSQDFARNNSRRKPKPTVKARVKAGIDAEFKKLFDKAHKNIEKALTSGDKQVSMWFMDVYLKRYNSRLDTPLKVDISTPEGLLNLSREALSRAKDGQIPFYQLKYIQDAVARHLVLSDSSMVADLRREIEELSATMQVKTSGKEHMPAWGRLRAITSQPTVIDHEDEIDALSDQSDPIPSRANDDEVEDPRARNLMDD